MKVIRKNTNLLVIEQRPPQVTILICKFVAPIAIIFFGGMTFTGIPWFACLVSMACVFFAIYLPLRMTTVVTCIIDRTLNTLTLKRINLVGQKVISHYLNEVQDIQIKIIKDSRADSYEIRAMLTTGGYLALNENMNSQDQINATEIVVLLKSFLNLHDRLSPRF